VIARALPSFAIAVASALLAIAPPALAASPPAGSLPRSAVVRVGDGLIARAVFNHWFDVAAASGTGPRWRKRDYDPPNFPACVAKKRKAESGGRRATKRRLKLVCRQEYEGLRDSVLEFLILEAWVAGETAELGLEPTAEALERAFQQAKSDTFPKESDFRAFLRRSGMSEADARFQVAFNTRYTGLNEHAIASAAPVTDADVAAYYAANPDEFEHAETRDLLVVLTKTRARAVAARGALERGATWRRVARRYSIDQASAAQGGRLAEVAEGTQERALDEAVFRAPKGALRGPVKTQFGYYVFKVVTVAPARRDSLEQATPDIRALLISERDEAVGHRFDLELRRKWKPRTACRAGFVTGRCANAG